MKKILHCLILLCVCLGMRLPCALQIANYTTVDVPISDQSTQTLEKVLPQALSQVLIKVSGNSNIASQPGVSKALEHAASLVQSYRYQNQTDSVASLIAEITFDEAGVTQLLQSLNQNVWVANRPLMLIVLQTQNDANNSILTSADQTNPLAVQLKQETNRRGIPYILPIMDLQDQAAFSTIAANPSTVAVNSNEQDANPANASQTNNNSAQGPLTQEAKRYEANVVLRGMLNEQNGSAQWTLYLNNQPIQWSDTATQQNDLITHAMDHVADLLSTQLAKMTSVSNGGSGLVQVIVLGINDLNDYANVIKNLKSLPFVTKVTVNDTQDTAISLSVQLQGNKDDLINAVSNNPNFSVVPDSQVEMSNGSLYLRWQTPQSNNQNNPSS